LAECKQLLSDPDAAELRAREILEASPGDPLARLLMAAVLRKRGHHAAARDALEPLSKSQPHLNAVWRELGLTFAALDEHPKAIHALQQAIDLDYHDKEAWDALAEFMTFPEHQDDKRITEPARFRDATMLFAQDHFRQALPHIEALLNCDPANTLYHSLKALALSWTRQFVPAVAEFESFIADCRNRPGLWLEYALLLRAERHKNAIPAFHRAIEILPTFADAYVSLASVKSSVLADVIVSRVRSQMKRTDMIPEDRAKFHFVLGKAFEDAKRYGDSFAEYRASNDILRASREYGSETSARARQLAKRFFTPAFFRAREGVGSPARDPIFIVGMPRAGSTLVEQILTSHSSIEGLGETPELVAIIESASKLAHSDTGPYPLNLKNLAHDQFRLLGEEYIARTRRRRRSDRPYFTDKLPSNFSNVGLIHLALPNAKIIDVRRHPLDCGFSCFKHFFPRGQPLSYDLRDIGRSYADYVELMAHYDTVLPARVHRVIYEHLIADIEKETRRLLEYIGLPFEEQCLLFHENKRLVLTLSADQVSRPLYTTGIGQWSHFEQWLHPLKKELGYILDIYPEVPDYYPEVHVRRGEPLGLGAEGACYSVARGLSQLPIENRRRSTVSPHRKARGSKDTQPD